MPAIDNPNSFDASLPGQLALIRRQIKDLGANSVYSPSAWHVGTGGLIVDGTSTLTGAATLTGGVAGPMAATGAVSGSSLSTPGGASVGGNANVSGQVISTGILQSPGSRANVITSYIAAQLDPSGNIGIVSSSVNVKQDFRAVDQTSEVEAILIVALLEFRYIEMVETYGEDATLILGGIAQYFDKIGLGRYVSRNEAGEIDGIQYDQLTKPLIATVQHLNKRLKATEARLDALEKTQAQTA